MSTAARGRFRVAAALALVSACASLPAPSAADERELTELFAQRTASDDVAGREVREARLTIDSRALSGTFLGVLASESAPVPRVRVQLLPDVGGKVLDLVATPALVRGYLPQAGLGIDVDLAAGERLPRHLLVLIAATALENAVPLDLARVRGARRREAGGWILAAESVLTGGEVRVELSADGALLSREYRLRGLSWRETLFAEHRIESGSMTVFIEETRRESADGLGEDVFELELPAGLSL